MAADPGQPADSSGGGVMAAPSGQGRLRHPWWARREIARLDPEHDARRIVHLSFEVRYGAPMFVHALFSMAFARQVAVPEIARVLDRNGTGTILSDTARRTDDTLIFFGALFRHADDAQGPEIAGRMRRIHARFPISNDLNLYTLATLACEPRRIARRLTGRELLSERENQALYHFWARVGGWMGITDIPDSHAALCDWMEDFERRRYAPTVGGQRVTRALAREFAERWFPRPLRAWAEGLYYALFDAPLLAAHGLPRPSLLHRALIVAAARLYLRGLVRLLPDPAERDLVGQFGARYGEDALGRAGSP